MLAEVDGPIVGSKFGGLPLLLSFWFFRILDKISSNGWLV